MKKIIAKLVKFDYRRIARLIDYLKAVKENGYFFQTKPVDTISIYIPRALRQPSEIASMYNYEWLFLIFLCARVRKEFAALSYLPEEEKKALGVKAE